jgi:hypothetical protein
MNMTDPHAVSIPLRTASSPRFACACVGACVVRKDVLV